MITQETARRIWDCYREIETAKKLLGHLEESFKKDTEPTPLDTWGRRQNYQFGIPLGENSHTLYSVKPRLALSVIRAHIADKESELIETNEQARIELGL